MAHHLIFEGAELSGKSWIMSQVYNFLEDKYNESGFILDGCHWLNCDIGVFGTKLGQMLVKKYLGVLEVLQSKNILVEKFYLSDLVYNRMYRGVDLDYSQIEKRLQKMDFKIILVKLPEDEKEIKKRINDRLKIYPHYLKIAHQPFWYIKQQREYIKEINKSKLPYLIIETNNLPDENLASIILNWLKEK